MSAQCIDGKQVSAQRRALLSREVSQLREQGVEPCLVALGLAGDHAWEVYTRNQERASLSVGIRYWRQDLSPDVCQEELLEAIEALNTDPDVHGIILQSPLPGELDERAAQALLSPDKDVEAVNPANLGLVMQGRGLLAPCTARAAVALAESHLGDLRGVETVVVGASVIVGRPLAELLLSAGATVSVCHIDTQDVASHTRRADLLIVAVGKPGLIVADQVKPGATVIDVGINRLVDSSGKTVTVGDVHPAVADVAGGLSPVPGGVGALTTTILLEATLAAARASRQSQHALGAAGMARMLGEAGAQLAPELLERLARMLSAHVVGGSRARKNESPLARRLGKRLLILDGAIGSELRAQGIQGMLEQANIDHPEQVLALHRAYIAAGAQVLTTNTFRCNRFSCDGNRERALRLAQAGVRLARQAAAGRLPVLGSMGPLGPMVVHDTSVCQGSWESTQPATAIAPVFLSPQAAEDASAEIALAMLDAGVDGFILETMPSTCEALAQLRALRRMSNLPILVSRSLESFNPAELRDFIIAVEAAGASALGVNCAAPRRLLQVLQFLAQHSSIPVFVLPNAGFPSLDEQGQRHYQLDAAYLLRYSKAYWAAGAALVGGCCGVGPQHIATLSDHMGQLSVQRPAAQPLAEPATEPAAGPEQPEVLDPLLQALRQETFPVLAMIPGHLSRAASLRLGQALVDAGSQGLGIIAGWPRGSGATGHITARLRLLADRHHCPAILELPAAALDLPQAAAALQDAHDLGLRHILIDTGVFSPLVQDPGRGMSAQALLALIAQGRQGFDLRGVRLDEPWSFTVGLRLGAEQLPQLSSFRQAGLDFLTLQPIYEPAVFRSAIARITEAELGLPLLAEILVLPDAETAEELNYEVPMLQVPEHLQRRLREDPNEDVRGVLGFLGHWRQRLSGVVLMLPDACSDQAVAVLRGLEQLR